MATITLTDRGTVNYNSSLLSALRDDDVLQIANTKVVIDSDPRWGYNNSTLRNFTIDIEQGGSLLIDGTKVWEIPFNSSSGFVPRLTSIETPYLVTGNTSGATGQLLNVWSHAELTPLSATSSNTVTLPQSGYIKLRSKTGNFIRNETITLPNNSTIVAASSGQRSWINVPFIAGYTGNANSLLCSFSAIGDWYELGVTSGMHNQSIPLPIRDTCFGIWVESAPGTEDYKPWQHAGEAWNIQRLFGSETDRTPLISTLSSTGNFFFYNSITNSLVIANSSTDIRCGYLPPSGCKIRMPNVFLSTAGNGTGPVVWTQDSTLGRQGAFIDNIIPRSVQSRFYLSTLTLKAKLVKANIAWFLYSASYSNYEILDCAIAEQAYFSGAEKIDIRNCIVSPCSGGTFLGPGNQIARTFFTNINTVYIENVSFVNNYSSSNDTRFDRSGAGIQISECGSFTVKNTTHINLLRDATYAINLSRNFSNGVVDNNVVLGSGGVILSNIENTTVKNLRVGNRASGVRPAVNNITTLATNSKSTNITIDGVYNLDIPGLDNLYTGIGFVIQDQANNIEIRNIGTETSPLSAGTRLFSFDDGYNIYCRRVYTAVPVDSTALPTQGGVFFVGNNAVGQLISNIVFENIYNTLSAANETTYYKNALLRGCQLRMSTLNTSIESQGTHWRDYFTDKTSGIIILLGNNPTDSSNYQVTQNLSGDGFPTGFSGTQARVAFNNARDNITWEMPYYALGHTGFTTRTPGFSGTQTTNLSAQFQYDNTKLGYNNAWLTLNANNLSGITIDPQIGVRLKIRVSAINRVADTSFYNLQIYTNTTEQAQKTFYPLPKNQNGTVINVIIGSRIQIFNETTQTELYNDIFSDTGDFIYPYNNGEGIDIGDIIRVRITKVVGATAKLRQELKTVADALGFTALAEQEDDIVYNNLNINGGTVTEFTADYPNIQVDVNDPNQTTSIGRLYAWWVYNENTLDGIRYYFNGLQAEDVGNYKIITNIVDLKLDNVTSQGLVFEGDFRLYRDDNQIPIVSPTSGGGSIVLYAGRVNVNTIELPTSGLTEQEAATLQKINTLPQDTFNVNVVALTGTNSVGARLKNVATVSNVSQIIGDALSL